MKDEPQHLTKGLITKDILKLAGIRYCVLDNKKKFKFLDKLLKHSRKNNTPVACLVKKNIFYKENKKSKNYKKNNNLIERNFFIKELTDKTKNFKIISTTGYISRDLHDQSSDIQKRNNFYVVGGMGHCSMIALGYSLFSSRKVLCLDGDGSMLMHLGALFTLGQNSKNNLKYILLNNNTHESVGSQKTYLDNINLKQIISAFKFDNYYLIKNKKELKKKLNDFLKSKKRSFLEVKMSNSNRNKNLGRPKNLIGIKKNFMN